MAVLYYFFFTDLQLLCHRHGPTTIEKIEIRTYLPNKTAVLQCENAKYSCRDHAMLSFLCPPPRQQCFPPKLDSIERYILAVVSVRPPTEERRLQYYRYIYYLVGSAGAALGGRTRNNTQHQDGGCRQRREGPPRSKRSR